jgi:hypothetical protein
VPQRARHFFDVDGLFDSCSGKVVDPLPAGATEVQIETVGEPRRTLARNTAEITAGKRLIVNFDVQPVTEP